MNNSKKLKCPIYNTHGRLNQAFSLFENILNDYQDPLRFTSALNNLIQNLRNVTFVLQKELAHTDGFAEWYNKEKLEMSKDKLLKWLINARNYVVKEGDLKKKSFAEVRLKDHYDQNILKLTLDPTLSTEEIAKNFYKKIPLKIHKNLLEQTVIEVEKIWTVDEYPEAEIIDILIHCLGKITDLIYRCHEELFNTNTLLCEQNLYIDPLENFRVVLHNKIKKGRITRINYKTGEIYGEIIGNINRPSDNILIQAKEKYGEIKSLSSLISTSSDDIPFNNIQYHLEMAKHLFTIDGFLVPMAFLYFPNRPPTHIILGLNDHATKYLVFEKLANTVEETNCEALIVVSEVWSGDMPKKGEEYIPAHIQKKEEYIWLIAATPYKKKEYAIKIVRDKDGKPSLNKEEIVENGEQISLDRIYKNWEINKKDIE